MQKAKQYIGKTVIAAFVITIVTFISIVLYSMGIRAENIFMLYTFGILFIIMGTKEYKFGIISALLIVAIFNYFFTEPRYSLRVNDRNYLISFVIFLIVSVIITSLAIKIQKQLEELERTQKVTDILYQISSGYLHVSGVEPVLRYGIKCLQDIKDGGYSFFVYDKIKNQIIPYTNMPNEPSEELIGAAQWCLEQSFVCGKGTMNYSDVPYYIIPVISKEVTYGVLAIEADGIFEKLKEKQVLEAVVSVIAMALGREYADAAEQASKIASERERLRNNLLRSISHDLRTPLAGITGSASFLLESYRDVDEEGRNTLLSDILKDSVWLSQLVDNLLNMTRIQDGRLNLHYEEEVVDDIVSEVSSRVTRRLGGRQLTIQTMGECMVVPMDGQLIIQVLVNLIDNAIKHTKEDGAIQLDVEAVNHNYVRFAITDNGTGISKEIQEHMFDSFVTTDRARGADSGRGMGLGLSIASEIVRVHGGTIGSYNNKKCGATVYFSLPLKGRKQHE